MRLRSAGDQLLSRQNTSRGDAALTAADVRQMLAQEIEHVNTNPDPHRRAALLGQLARVALRAIELSRLEAPIDEDQRPFTLVLGDRPIKLSDEKSDIASARLPQGDSTENYK